MFAVAPATILKPVEKATLKVYTPSAMDALREAMFAVDPEIPSITSIAPAPVTPTTIACKIPGPSLTCSVLAVAM